MQDRIEAAAKNGENIVEQNENSNRVEKVGSKQDVGAAVINTGMVVGAGAGVMTSVATGALPALIAEGVAISSSPLALLAGTTVSTATAFAVFFPIVLGIVAGTGIAYGGYKLYELFSNTHNGPSANVPSPQQTQEQNWPEIPAMPTTPLKSMDSENGFGKIFSEEVNICKASDDFSTENNGNWPSSPKQ